MGNINNKIQIGSEIVASLDGKDVMYDEETSLNKKIEELLESIENVNNQVSFLDSKVIRYGEIFGTTITTDHGTFVKRANPRATSSAVISFSDQFISIPIVTAAITNAVNYKGGNMSGYVSMTVRDITKTSFIVDIKNTHTSDGYYADCTVTWTAEAVLPDETTT